MSDVTTVTNSDIYKEFAVPERQIKRLKNRRTKRKKKINPQKIQELYVQDQLVEQGCKHQNIHDPGKILRQERKPKIRVASSFS